MYLRYASTCLLLCSASSVAGDDWPQWLGPGRDAVWRESGVIETIPPEGLPVKWRAPVHWGYSGPAVANGRVFLMDYEAQSDADGDKLQGRERVACFSADSGDLIWEHSYDQPYGIDYSKGPRCTPTVDHGKVYALGAEGRLTCLDESTGDVVWEKSLTDQYNTKTAVWGYASHPLIEDDLLYTIAGGDGSVCIALNKQTGDEVWTALSAPEQGYVAPTMITHGDVKQLLIWHPLSLNSLHPKTGEVFWSIPLRPSFGMSIMGPRKLENYVYASAIGNVSALIELDDRGTTASVVWRGKPKTSIFCSNSTPFLEDGTIYGCDVESGALMAADIEDGRRLWQTREPTNGSKRRSRHATAFLTKHDDRFFLFNELGDLIVARLSREGYDEQGQFHVLEPTNEAFGRKVVWSSPAYAGRCLFARNDEELVCVDLAAPDQ